MTKKRVRKNLLQINPKRQNVNESYADQTIIGGKKLV